MVADLRQMLRDVKWNVQERVQTNSGPTFLSQGKANTTQGLEFAVNVGFPIRTEVFAEQKLDFPRGLGHPDPEKLSPFPRFCLSIPLLFPDPVGGCWSALRIRFRCN